LVEKKIYILMKRLGINSGSIDMVYTKDGRFVFLEVNPVGQFAQVSMPCNYFLEREIAYELSNAKTIQL
jgi:D-alanine-D-alanine ligase-like ATP-grasp enzyme